MSDLIPISDDGGKQAVLGRDLHTFLQVDSRYTTWFARMIAYGFTEGKDYLPKKGTVERAGRGDVAQHDHILTLDMAKHLAMVQRTERGRQAREYFLECEKAAKSQKPLTGRALMAAALVEAEETLAALETTNHEQAAQLEAAAPKLEYHDKFISTDDDVMSIGDWGAHFGLTRPESFERLVAAKIIYRKVATREFSQKKGELVDRGEYRAYSAYRTFFDLRAQHNAPRYHNGQVRQTLYVKSAFAASLADHPGLEDLMKVPSA